MRNQEYISPIDQYVIDFIRELRKEKNLTQRDIASIVGISRAFVSEIESKTSRAKYNIRHVNALADYLGMSPREFLPEKALPSDTTEKKTGKKSAKTSGVKLVSPVKRKQS